MQETNSGYEVASAVICSIFIIKTYFIKNGIVKEEKRTKGDPQL